MPSPTWLPAIEIHADENQLELEAPWQALVQLADMICGEMIRAEVTPEDGSVLRFRVTNGPLVVGHQGKRVNIAGGRGAFGDLAHLFRFVAAGPQSPSEVRYHAHVEYFPGHRWLAAESVSMVVTLAE